MNRYFRLMMTLLKAPLKSRAGILDITSTEFTVLPTDLDLYLHMNNAMYFSLMDLARIDYTVRTGLKDDFEKLGYYSVVASETFRFRKSLKLFDRFTVKTQVVGWNEKFFFIRQTFVKGGQIVGTGTVKVRTLKRKGGTVSPEQVLAEIGQDHLHAGLPQHVEEWVQADDNGFVHAANELARPI